MPKFVLMSLLLSLAATAAHAETTWRYDNVERVVAVSDVHGAHAALVRTLRNAAVIDADERWTGGETHLVIVGDILDRGPDSRASMDMLMALEPQAEAAGGRVHVLLGNHEAMNLIGDMRYVANEEFAAFAAEETEAEREHWFGEYLTQRMPTDAPLADQREAFRQSFPPGYFAHRRAFAPDGRYGAWLLDKPIMVTVNDSAFVHAGLSVSASTLTLDAVNVGLRSQLTDYVDALATLTDALILLPTDAFHDHQTLVSAALETTEDPDLREALARLQALAGADYYATDGPLWYRGNVRCPALIEIDRLQVVLDALGVRRVVLGHTPTPTRDILQRLDGRVVEIDTGMLNRYYRGHGHALVIEGDSLKVVDENESDATPVTEHPRRVGARRNPALTAAAIETLLREGRVAGRVTRPDGLQILNLSDGEQVIDAVFTRRAARGVFPETAAYRLDRLLGLDMVPVTVVREIEGRAGSLQFLPAGAINEQQRFNTGGGAGASCAIPDQWDAMYVFDALIYNEARFLRSILYNPGSWQLMLTAHDKAFTRATGRPSQLADRELKLTPAWLAALDALTDEALQMTLGDVLDKRRLRALAERRDALRSTESPAEKTAVD